MTIIRALSNSEMGVYGVLTLRFDIPGHEIPVQKDLRYYKKQFATCKVRTTVYLLSI